MARITVSLNDIAKARRDAAGTHRIRSQEFTTARPLPSWAGTGFLADLVGVIARPH